MSNVIRTYVETFYKEQSDGKARADVVQDTVGNYWIEYFDPRGELVAEESFEGHSIHYVQDAAENWVAGIKVLNG